MLNNNLTDQKYWESYYANSHTQRKQIETVVSLYDSYWDKLMSLPDSHPKTLIEIGGYPGRYLAYLGHKYQLKPTCFDFNSDRIKVDESMAAFGIQDYQVIQDDIFNYIPKEKYDVVISNGFIEHFQKFDEVLDLHYNFLNEGGSMLIMIPNKRGLRKLYGYLVDFKNLKAHNLKCMNKDTFIQFAQRHPKLELLEVEYFGGFPFSVHQKLNILQKIVYKSTRLIFKKINPFLAKHPSSWYSSTLIAVYKMKND